MRTFRCIVLLAWGATAFAAGLPAVTLQPRTATLRLAVTGDTGDGAAAVAKGIARVHAASPLDAILLTGDNFYPCGVTSESDPRWSVNLPLTRVGVPVFPVLGNHDYCGKADPDAQVRASEVIGNWRFPSRQYALRTPVADFAFVDTTPFVRGGRDGITPIIRQTFAASKKPWRVVVGHHPVISSGYHGYFPRTEVAKMRTLIPLLREERIDLFICGHDHHVELIRGRMLHLISGAGSSPVPPIKLRSTTVFPDQIRLERIGFAVVEIAARSIRVRMYDGNGKPRTEWISARVRRQPAPE
ncbi:MAG TPA: metallophosphoesterase [Thermoanaerobaculia bacterium]|nr:metallophosphoesterase [Thermoanaerobaculia bacterium]